MNAKQKVVAQAQLDAIKVGENYPSSVRITEMFKGKKMETSFNLQSYYVGMYCAIYCNGKLAAQQGDHNNRGFVTKLKKDIQKAINRKDVLSVEISAPSPVKKDMN